MTVVSDEDAASTPEYMALQVGTALQPGVERTSDPEFDQAIALLDRMIRASDDDDIDVLLLSSRDFVDFAIRAAGNTALLRVLRNERARL